MKNKNKDLNFPDISAQLRDRSVNLLEESRYLTISDLVSKFPGKTIFVCDAYVRGIEKGISEGGILRLQNVISIDHHAPLKMFARKVSSVNLAICWVNKKGIAPKNAIVIITHTDYDSIISSLIMRGIILPEKIFGDMAIMADHTGEEDEIVDLLQSMSSAHDLEFSLRNLELWSKEEPIEEKAQKMLEDLKDERRRAEEAVSSGKFDMKGTVYYAKLNKKIESAFFTALIPGAAVILTFSPHRKHKGFWEVKTRLGAAAPEGLCLNKLGIDDFDSSWGGRWNAGSNRRGEGTKLTIEEYAELLNKKLEQFFRERKNKQLK